MCGYLGFTFLVEIYIKLTFFLSRNKKIFFSKTWYDWVLQSYFSF